MNSLSSFQRKMLYLLGMIVLIGPIVWLGMPAGATGKQERLVGELARMRADYELGETSLGDVDPASSTMNLVLLGMRGLASSQLWQEAIEQQKRKEWAEMRATTNSIILLQPHYVKVWNFQGWNLAYNVSQEWDAVSDRYYWVKEGIKFIKKGRDRNQRHPELYWYLGHWTGHKIGRSDEWRQFRNYFRGHDQFGTPYPDPEPDPNDPEPDFRKRKKRFELGYDTELNELGKDNWLVAKGWLTDANERELAAKTEGRANQHIMARELFRGSPMRAQIEYAQALQKEGLFDEVAQEAWAQSFIDWTTIYGQDEIETEAGKIKLETSGEEFARQAEADRKILRNDSRKSRWIEQYWKMTNYPYWRARILMESERNIDILTPVEVEPGDMLTVTLNGKTRALTAKSGDPADVAKALVELWKKAGDPEFDAIRAEVVTQPVPAVKLTWNTTAIPFEPIVAAKNGEGGTNDNQKLERRIERRSIVEAHRELYNGEQALFAADEKEAARLLYSGLEKFELSLSFHRDLMDDDDLIENMMVALVEWREALGLQNEPIPENYPMKAMFERRRGMLKQIEDEIKRRRKSNLARPANQGTAKPAKVG